jgi:3-oxoacyl-[acyl-carrier protein] reductase
MREHGPAEYGEGTTLSDAARDIGRQFTVAATPVLGDLTCMGDVERVIETVAGALGPSIFSSTMPAAISRRRAASPIRTTR